MGDGTLFRGLDTGLTEAAELTKGLGELAEEIGTAAKGVGTPPGTRSSRCWTDGWCTGFPLYDQRYSVAGVLEQGLRVFVSQVPGVVFSNLLDYVAATHFPTFMCVISHVRIRFIARDSPKRRPLHSV